MGNISFQAILLEEIKLIFEPITEIQSDIDIVRLFENFGYNIEAITGNNLTSVNGGLTGISTAVNGLNNINLNSFDSILGTVNTFKSLVTIPNAVSNINGSISSSIVDSNNQPIKNGIPIDLLNYLLVNYLFENHPKIYRTFELLGIIYFEGSNRVIYNGKTVRDRQNVSEIDLSKLGQLLSNTKQYLGDLYIPYNNGISDQKIANEVSNNLFTRISYLLYEFGFFTALGNGSPSEQLTSQEQEVVDGIFSLSKDFVLSNNTQAGFGFIISLIANSDKNKQGIAIAPRSVVEISEIIGSWILALKISAQSSGLEITGEGVSFFDTTQNNYKFKLSLDSISSPDNPLYRVGSDKGTRFELDRMGFEAFLDLQPPDKLYGIMMKLHQMKFVLKGGDGDGMMLKL